MDDNRRLRVMHVLKSSIYSGAENVVITIIRNLKSQIEFLYVSTDGMIRGKLEQEKIPHQLLRQFDRANLSRVIHQWKPDIVHAHDFSATVISATVFAKFRLISHLHYDPPWVKGWNIRTVAYMCCSWKIEKIMVVSEKSFSHMIFQKHVKGKTQIVGNPIDGKQILQLAHVSGVALDKIDKTDCDIMFVGRFVEQKDPQRFIRIVKLLKENGFPNISAQMLGDGELRSECIELMRNLGVENNIQYLGFQENPYIFMKKSKLLCITSRWEGFGLVATEANILGIPVLCTDNSGCCEIFGENAPEICCTDDIFLKKATEIIENTEVRMIWKKRALDQGKKFNNIQQYIESIKNVYGGERKD